jgi:hypothetical protein
MSQINIAGDTSGSIAVVAPLVAGSNTITLPASTGTVLTSVSPASDLPSSIKGPAFSAYKSANQTGISNSTWTKVTFDTEEFDTNNNFASSTFTPTVAGYYQINTSVMSNATTVNPTFVAVNIYKNGASIKNVGVTGNSVYVSGMNSIVVYLNGSTDYIEVYTYIIGATGGLFAGGQNATWINGAMIRSA